MTTQEITVLLIEDNLGDVRLVQNIFKEIKDVKIKLIVAETKARGLKHIAAELIHVILLDLNLPDSRGIETFRQVHRFALKVPVIILSVLSEKELIYQALKEGAQHYLIKDKIENETLVQTIRYAMWSHYHPA